MASLGDAINPRYFLIALDPDRTTKSKAMYTITKNLWALGHYSLFVRPGMYRIETERNDGLADTAVAQQVMISAFRDKKGENLVVNLINYTQEPQQVDIVLEGLIKNKALKLTKHFVTSAKKGDDLRPYPINEKTLPGRSINTFVFTSK